MSTLNLENLKTNNKNVNNSRLSLDQFKIQNSNSINSEELEKLTGGILGACHPDPHAAEGQAQHDVVKVIVEGIKSIFN